MDEKEYISNLIEDKMLFDEVLSGVGLETDKELEEEYKSGIKYQKELENHNDK